MNKKRLNLVDKDEVPSPGLGSSSKISLKILIFQGDFLIP